MSSQALACAVSLCEVSLDPLQQRMNHLLMRLMGSKTLRWVVYRWLTALPWAFPKVCSLDHPHQSHLGSGWGMRSLRLWPTLSPPHNSNPVGLEGVWKCLFLSTSSPGVILHTDTRGPLLWGVSSSGPGKSVTNARGTPWQPISEWMNKWALFSLKRDWDGVGCPIKHSQEKRSLGRDKLSRCGTSCWHRRNKPECE